MGHALGFATQHLVWGLMTPNGAEHGYTAVNCELPDNVARWGWFLAVQWPHHL